jgi:hypothetical protein
MEQRLLLKNIFEVVANFSLPFENERQKKPYRASPDSFLGGTATLINDRAT